MFVFILRVSAQTRSGCYHNVVLAAALFSLSNGFSQYHGFFLMRSTFESHEHLDQARKG